TISILIGSVQLNPITIWKIIINKIFSEEIFQSDWTKNIEVIVWNLRMPRVLMSIIVGASLSLAGILMQALTKNTLADPYILGISSGASTGAILVIILGGAGIFSVPLGAFTLGLLTSFLVFYNSSRENFSTSKLVLTGIAISSFFSGITTFLIVSASKETEVKSVLFWMTGSLSGSTWSSVGVSFLALLVSSLVIYSLHRELDIIMTGDEIAETLGVNVSRLRLVIVVVASLLSSFIVANTGIIGFVGLVIPHIGRGIIGAKHKRLIIFSILIGGIFLLVTDCIARVLLKGQEVPLGVITSMIGAPFFMWLIKKSSYSFGGN
ncbi:MAG: FecCD family ABC transporter permease, partial [Fusobacteriaceae bacterium]